MDPGGCLRMVRIPPQGDRGLGFDLAEVMAAVGEFADLRWVLRWVWFNGDVSAVWPDGVLGVEASSRLDGGVVMTWEQMRRLASAGPQIIDGEFSGYHRAGLCLRLEAVDSSYWTVMTDDPATLARVRAAFHGVVDEPETSW